MTAAGDRLPRLLALVPYLQARPGIRLGDAAADLDITEEQLRRDLELLWVCGLPGHGPGDLIDLSFEGETVDVIFDAGIHRPLRLTQDEALALVVALRTLAAVPGLTDPAVLDRALAKIEAAVGGQARGAEAISVELDSRGVDGGSASLAAVRRGLAEHRALHLRYYTAGRDEVSERTVDPMRLLLVDGYSYLEAWCRLVEDVRLFRLDRADRVVVLGEPAAPPPSAVPRDLTGGVFQPAPEHATVTLQLGPRSRWAADYYPCERVTELDGAVEVVLRVADPDWARRLVLGLGPDALVVDPPTLAAEIRREAVVALAVYDATGDGHQPAEPAEQA
ncbi:WYL domain-containing protein [soil metagenome]